MVRIYQYINILSPNIGLDCGEFKEALCRLIG